MLPVVALVGRPNVGKSTLFNRLTRSRDALVADFPGLTRDRKYGQANYDGYQFIVVDTGGIHGDEEGIDEVMAKQSLQPMSRVTSHELCASSCRQQTEQTSMSTMNNPGNWPNKGLKNSKNYRMLPVSHSIYSVN